MPPCEVVLRRSAARRPTHAEVRRSHDTSVVTPPLRFAKPCRYQVARSRAAGLRACESVFPPPHSPRERLKAGHREAWPRARACLAVSRHRPSIRGSPRTLATIRPPVAARPPPRARHYCCTESRCALPGPAAFFDRRRRSTWWTDSYVRGRGGKQLPQATRRSVHAVAHQRVARSRS